MLNLSGVWTTYNLPLDSDEAAYPLAVGRDKEDQIWVGVMRRVMTLEQGFQVHSSIPTSLFLLKHNQWTEHCAGEGPFPDTGGYFHNMVCSELGELWYYNPTGFFCHFDGTTTKQFSLGQDGVPPFVGGLPQFVADNAGGIWVAMNEKGACHYQNGEWEVLSDIYSIFSGEITSVVLDHNGRVWFAVSNDHQVSFVVDDQGKWERWITISKPRKKETPRHIAFESDGTLWVAWGQEGFDSRLGLWVFSPGGQVQTQFTTRNSHLTTTNIRSLSVDTFDRIWVGGYGVTVFDKDQSACWITISPDVMQPATSCKEAERLATDGDQLLKVFLTGGPFIDRHNRPWAQIKKGVALFTEHLHMKE